MQVHHPAGLHSIRCHLPPATYPLPPVLCRLSYATCPLTQVLFHPGQAAQWPHHWGSWYQNASILFEAERVISGTLDVIATLRRVPRHRVAQFQNTIAERAHSVVYSAVDSSAVAHALHDAFDISLDVAWRRARNASAAAEGRRAQLSARHEDIALTAFHHMPREHTGYCDGTDDGPSDCEKGEKGMWQLSGELQGVGDCIARCASCARCNYISISHTHKDCSWFNQCSMAAGGLGLAYGGETYRTMRVDSNRTKVQYFGLLKKGKGGSL